jgi:23S rRNA (uracil1939-C5)-methyltransferase
MAVYVSCNPEALAHDLRIITAHGYRIVSMQPVDMFPHTAHVETVVVVSAPARRS